MLAIIPARGGSKGLPGKNIKELNGKPLIAYTIEAAKKVDEIDRVVVNTDSEEIAEVAKKYGAEIPFMRSRELASDTASAIDVYIDTIKRLKYEEDCFIVLLPTAPLRTEKHIKEAIDLFRKKGAKTLISIQEAATPASWYMQITQEGKLESLNYGVKSGNTQNRQVNQKEYIPNGAIYILSYALLEEKRTYYCCNTIPYIMSRNVSVDIDTLDDFYYAEYLMKKRG